PAPARGARPAGSSRVHGDATQRFLARVAYERARVLAPLCLIGQVATFVVSEPMGIALTPPVIAFNVIAVTAMAILTAALWRRRLPVRWAHVALVLEWCCAVGGTLISQYYNGHHQLVLLVFIEIAMLTASLHLGLAIGALGVLGVLYVPLVVRDAGPDAAIYIATLATGALFALVVQTLIRRSLASAEDHRLVEAATSVELAHRLAELQTSEAERHRLQDQLIHSQRMEAVGTLAAGVAHDMNNVLAAITSYASLVVECAPALARPDLDQILTQASRGAELTRGLLAFSRRGQYRKQVVAFDQIVRDVVPLLERTLPKGITLVIELAADHACVDGDAVQLGQSIINFSINAADAMDGSGTLAIRTARVGRDVRVSVTDTGSGMDDATRLRVFEPFFTTKSMGKGTGLGLSTVWGIAEAHAGAVGVDSKVGAGSTFWMTIPQTSQRPSTQPVVVVEEAEPEPATVLIVDDEPAVREGCKRLLERKGHRVLCAENGAEGLRVFDEHAAAIGLVVLDMGMPVMNGAECFEQLRTRSQVPVLIATGYAIDLEAQSLITRGASLIEKPYASADLTARVARLLTG
ncbi:MAG: response regulator, partial [Kofleriaceae bacterium]